MSEKLEFFNADDKWLLKLCGNRFVTNDKDFNLKEGSKSVDRLDLFPVTGGLYDGRLFGSLYSKRCNCGAVRRVGERCHSCNTIVLSEAERATRYCAYISPIYYSNEPRLEVLKKRIYEVFDEVRVELSTTNDLFKGKRTSWTNIFYLCQFESFKENNKKVLLITDDLVDVNKISLEGLVNAVDSLLPSFSNEVRTYMNKVIPIYPIALRPVVLSVVDGKKKVQISKHSIIFRSIINMINTYSSVIESEDNIYAETLLKATLRSFIGNQIYNMSALSKRSKENFFRTSYTHRVAGSGRAVISPDPKLKITEVGIPFFLAYELYKVEFISYIEKTHFLDHKEAENIYKEARPDVLDLFEQFVEENDKHVLLNRNPTLHKYNILCLKVKLVKDSTVHVPPMLCELFAGDFDGDEMNFFAVPNELKEYVVKNASPKNMTYYEKDHEFLFKFNHESLNGIIISSKVVQESENPRKYVSMDDVEEAFKESEIEVDTAIYFNDKLTSYGRLKISEIIEADLDALIGDNVVINAVNIAEIYALVSKYDGDKKADILQRLQEFVLEMVYISGETTLSLEEVYQALPKEFLKDIKKIMSDKNLSDADKLMYIQNIHEVFLSDYIDKVDSKVKLRIKESSRMKMNAYIEMNTPQVLYNTDGSVHVSSGTLINGLSESEYVSHALNNRKLLELKFEAVPTAGYLTRQLSILGMSLVLKLGDDIENEGLLIPRNRAEGRTMVNGGIVGKSDSDELVRVRSILTSDKNYLTPDMISTFNDINIDSDGVDHKGTSFMMALTESSTQRGLSLKHGGSLRTVIESKRMKAYDDCELSIYDKHFELKFNDGFIAKYPKTDSISFMNKKSFKKGDLICQLTKTDTFSYVLDCVIKTVRAIGKVTLGDIKNQITNQRCISVVDGILRYNFDEGYLTIGSETIPILPDTIYYIPDGEKVTAGQKFCSGLENIQALSSKLTYIETYNVFRSQMRDLMPNITEEIFESLYYLITNKTNNSFIGVHSSNREGESFAPNLAYGYATRGIIRAMLGETKIKQDVYTNALISPFLVNDMMKAIDNNH